MENILEKALTPNTYILFEEVSKLECIKTLVLCGGTAQALQQQHRMSEDLDFEVIGTRKDRPQLQSAQIVKEIQEKFPGATFEPMGDDHFQMMLPGNVKLSFFRPENNVPSYTPSWKHNNIETPSLQELLGMKLYVITQRIAFRDYYDIYSLLKEGYNLHDGIKYACDFSKHTIHSKDILNRLMSPSLYQRDENFLLMNPIYDIDNKDIRDFIKTKMQEELSKTDVKDKILKNFQIHTLTDSQNLVRQNYQKFKKAEASKQQKNHKQGK